MENKQKIAISGMHCSNCASTIEDYFNNLDGIKVNVLLSSSEGIFTYDTSKWNEKLIAKHLKKIGYGIKDNKNNKDIYKLIANILFTIPFIYFMIAMANNTYRDYFIYIELILSTIVLVLGGHSFRKGMIRDFKNKRLGMDVLVSLGTLIAYIYSLITFILDNGNMTYFATATMLITVVSIGKYIEEKARFKATSSLEKLMSLQERQAKLVKNNTIELVDVASVKVNDIIIVEKGSVIPLDGFIIDNTIDVDTSMMTGESLPVSYKKDDQVYSGYQVINGSCKIKVCKTLDDTYLASMIKKVEDIQTKKPRMQKIADKIASIFVPVVCIISLFTSIITYLITKDIETSILKMISVIMISCPCSLGLATPLSILIGSSKAIRNGIIYNNTDIFENLSKVDIICFDKTGTLSTGKLEITKATYKDSNALDIAYTLESISTHPIAKAICNYAKANNAKLLSNLNPEEVIGKGIFADSYSITKENNKVILKYSNNTIAEFEVVDLPKKEAKELIARLSKSNIKFYLISGDNKEATIEFASSIGLDNNNIFYNVKPDEKKNIIESLSKDNKKVCFVGDGTNDILALNVASLSIAMGSGTDIAKSYSDITLSNNNLLTITKAIKLSRSIYFNIIKNFMWAFLYNLVAIPLSILGIINPIISGLCMAASSILVVLNSLSLYLIRD